MEKFNRTCVYCSKTDVSMEVEHIVPRSGGGGNKVSNLPLSCRPCNEKTDNQTTTEFGYPEVQAKAKRSLRDAAAGKDLT